MITAIRILLCLKDVSHESHLSGHNANVLIEWVKRVFASKSLTSIVTTSLEIQKLVQSFLNIRMRIMPRVRCAALPSMNANGESQDEYGEWDLDYDDPELIAALETNIAPAVVKDNAALDQRLAKVMDEDISPAIYRFVIKHFSDESISSPPKVCIEDYCRDADRWVECWVGCAAVIVHNKRRASISLSTSFVYAHCHGRIGRTIWNSGLSLGSGSAIHHGAEGLDCVSCSRFSAATRRRIL